MKRYLIQYVNKHGDRLCKVILALTMFDAVASLPFGSRMKEIQLIGHSV